jgi:hypothetical protein
MEEILKLRRLKEFGIPVSVLARECHCSLSAMNHYINEMNLPNGAKTMAIKDGLKHIFNTIMTIIKE